MTDYFLIVPAAGSGQRMQSLEPKQYLRWRHKTLLEHSIEPFLSLANLKKIVVALQADDPRWQQLSLAKHVLIDTAIGGPTRAESVLNALNTLAPIAKTSDWVLVHDAARPFIKIAMIQQLIEALQGHPIGGLLAIPTVDTLKQTQLNSNQVERTLNRNQIWRAQTPQMFPYGLLQQALIDCLQAGQIPSDESEALEYAGYRPLIIPGDPQNIKVTYPQDLPQ